MNMNYPRLGKHKLQIILNIVRTMCHNLWNEMAPLSKKMILCNGIHYLLSENINNLKHVFNSICKFILLFFLNLSNKRHVRPSWSGRGWCAWCSSLKLLFIFCLLFLLYCCFSPFMTSKCPEVAICSINKHLQRKLSLEIVDIKIKSELVQVLWPQCPVVIPIQDLFCRSVTANNVYSGPTTQAVATLTTAVSVVLITSVLTNDFRQHNCYNKHSPGGFNPSFKFFCDRMELICAKLQIMFRFFHDSVQYK